LLGFISGVDIVPAGHTSHKHKNSKQRRKEGQRYLFVCVYKTEQYCCSADVLLPNNAVVCNKRTFCKYLPGVFSSLRGTRLVEALFYKPEGRGFDFRWGHWDFSLP
jgi:hypothetical protein